MYSLKRNAQGFIDLYEGVFKLVKLPDNSIITVEFILDFKMYSKTYTDLNDFLKEVEDTSDFDTLDVVLKTTDNNYTLVFDKTSDTKEIRDKINLPYIKELYKFDQGLSDLKYVNEYLPAWSTAFKNIYSNHTRTFEPVFTQVLDIKYNVNNLINSEPLQSIKNVIFYKRKSNVKIISTKAQSYLKNRVDYTFNSNVLLNFGHQFNTIYIEFQEKTTCTIRVKGIYNDAFIKEDIKLTETSVITLSNKYNKIFSIDLVDFSEYQIPTETIKISNMLNIEGFLTQQSSERVLEYVSDKIAIKKKGVIENVFINTIPNYFGMYIDSQDSIVAVHNNMMYTAKLNLKLDLDIPKDLSYNNTQYIETIFLNPNEYEIAIDAYGFVQDVSTERCSISIMNSNKEVYYLDDSNQLVKSDEEIFIYLKSTDKIHINLELDSAVEYVIISLKDSNSFYKKSNLIVQPFIEFIPNLKLLDTERLVKMNDIYYFYDSVNLKLKELSISPTQMSLIDTPPAHSYYYLSTETYLSPAESSDVSQALTNFKVDLYDVKFEYDLDKSDTMAGNGSFLVDVSSSSSEVSINT